MGMLFEVGFLVSKKGGMKMRIITQERFASRDTFSLRQSMENYEGDDLRKKTNKQVYQS